MESFKVLIKFTWKISKLALTLTVDSQSLSKGIRIKSIVCLYLKLFILSNKHNSLP